MGVKKNCLSYGGDLFMTQVKNKINVCVTLLVLLTYLMEMKKMKVTQNHFVKCKHMNLFISQSGNIV